MNPLRRILFLSTFIIYSCSAFATAAFKADRDYTVLPSPATLNSRPLVEGIFLYTCPHCNDLEPELKTWAEENKSSITFVHLPAVFDDKQTKVLAQAYYTFMAIAPQLHQQFFAAIQVQRLKLFTAPDIVAWVNKQGIDGKAFSDVFYSFTTEMKVKKAEQKMKDYQIRSVPTFIVQGKYSTSPGMTKSTGKTMFDTLDFLVEKARSLSHESN